MLCRRSTINIISSSTAGISAWKQQKCPGRPASQVLGEHFIYFMTSERIRAEANNEVNIG